MDALDACGLLASVLLANDTVLAATLRVSRRWRALVLAELERRSGPPTLTFRICNPFRRGGVAVPARSTPWDELLFAVVLRDCVARLELVWPDAMPCARDYGDAARTVAFRLRERGRARRAPLHVSVDTGPHAQDAVELYCVLVFWMRVRCAASVVLRAPDLSYACVAELEQHVRREYYKFRAREPRDPPLRWATQSLSDTHFHAARTGAAPRPFEECLRLGLLSAA